MGLFNSTCPLPKDFIDRPNAEKPIVGDIKFQKLMFYIGAASSILAMITTLLLVIRHLLCYTRPAEQRQIIRIIMYPLVFALMSTFSILSYPDSLYLEPASELYEPIALVGIFFLFIEFGTPDKSTREFFFDRLENRKFKGGKFSRNKGYDVIPGGSLRWYQSKWVAIYFYFFATIVIKIVEEITQAAGRFCQYSFSPAFAHVWVIVISYIALPVGVLAVVQLYMRLKDEDEFRVHGALSKLISFKAIIFINFIQGILFDILTGTHAIKAIPPTVTLEDFSIGLKALLVCVEQMIVAIWFHWTFGTKEYRAAKNAKQPRLSFWRAAVDALNPSDIIRGLFFAFGLLMKGIGPKGNGGWTKISGYKQVGQPSNIQYQASTTYGDPRNRYGTSDGHDDQGSEHMLLTSQAPVGSQGYGGGLERY